MKRRTYQGSIWPDPSSSLLVLRPMAHKDTAQSCTNGVPKTSTEDMGGVGAGEGMARTTAVVRARVQVFCGVAITAEQRHDFLDLPRLGFLFCTFNLLELCCSI